MLQSNALSDKCGHKATYEKSKVCGAASQQGTRRGGQGSGGLCLAASTLQKAMGATIIVLGAAAAAAAAATATSSATTAAAAARGDHIAQHVAQCEKLEQRSTGWRRAANSCRVAARAWATTAPQLQAQLQPVSCAPLPTPLPLLAARQPFTIYHIHHKAYTPYAYSYLEHRHTHTHNVSIHNWAAEYAKEFSKRAIKIVFFN